MPGISLKRIAKGSRKACRLHSSFLFMCACVWLLPETCLSHIQEVHVHSACGVMLAIKQEWTADSLSSFVCASLAVCLAPSPLLFAVAVSDVKDGRAFTHILLMVIIVVLGLGSLACLTAVIVAHVKHAKEKRRLREERWAGHGYVRMVSSWCHYNVIIMHVWCSCVIIWNPPPHDEWSCRGGGTGVACQNSVLLEFLKVLVRASWGTINSAFNNIQVGDEHLSLNQKCQ